MSCERGLNFDQEKYFPKTLSNERLIMSCLQIYRELLSFTIFLRVHSNSEEVSYLFWQNTYSNLKTTCRIQLKFFLWTKLLENSFLAKYLISVTAPLTGGGSGSGKINVFRYTNVYLHSKDPYEAKYQLLINKRESTGIKHLNNWKAFIKYSNDMDNIYKNIKECNPYLIIWLLICLVIKSLTQM